MGNGEFIEFFVFRHSTLGGLTEAWSARSCPEIAGGNPSGVLQPAHLEPYARETEDVARDRYWLGHSGASFPVQRPLHA